MPASISLTGTAWPSWPLRCLGDQRHFLFAALIFTLAFALTGCGRHDVSDAEFFETNTANPNSQTDSTSHKQSDFLDTKSGGSDAINRLVLTSDEYLKDPENVDKALSYATALRLVGSFEQAKEILVRAIQQNPNVVNLNLELAKLYLLESKFSDALPLMQRAKIAAPRNWRVHALEGLIHDTDGNHAIAQRAFNLALVYKPNEPRVLNNLGLSQALSGNTLAARHTLARAAYLAKQPSANGEIRAEDLDAILDRIEKNINLLDSLEKNKTEPQAKPEAVAPQRPDPPAARLQSTPTAPRSNPVANRRAPATPTATQSDYTKAEAWQPLSRRSVAATAKPRPVAKRQPAARSQPPRRAARQTAVLPPSRAVTPRAQSPRAQSPKPQQRSRLNPPQSGLRGSSTVDNNNNNDSPESLLRGRIDSNNPF